LVKKEKYFKWISSKDPHRTGYSLEECKEELEK